MKTALIIGNGSDIAVSAAAKLQHSHKVLGLNRSQVDLANIDSEDKLHEYLKAIDPDCVINCAGVFGDNSLPYDTVMSVNFKSNWSVIKYYIDNPPSKVVKFVMVGSSTYSQGRKNHILYAASKSALYSMWQGASEYVSENLILGLINPVRVNTKMVQHLTHPTPELCLEASDVANKIVDMCHNMTVSQSVDMGYKSKEIL